MNVRAKRVAYEDVDVNPKDVCELLCHGIRESVHIPHGAWVSKDGHLKIDDESGPGRPWEQDLGPATDEQKRLAALCDDFTEAVRKAFK